MIRAIQIGKEVVVMVGAERDGKIDGLEMRIVPLPMWQKLYGPKTEQPNN